MARKKVNDDFNLLKYDLIKTSYLSYARFSIQYVYLCHGDIFSMFFLPSSEFLSSHKETKCKKGRLDNCC